MSNAVRVVLLMSPGAGYDRGLLRGIARYARNHGPWVFFLAGDQPGIPLPTVENIAVKLVKAEGLTGRRGRNWPLNLKGLGATGFIGRLTNPRVSEAVLSSGLPAIALDLTDQQLSEDNPLGGLSEICPDSYKAGRLAAEHLLDRGFKRFAFCGYPNENWSRRREAGFCERLQEAGFGCERLPLFERKSRSPWHREQPTVTAWLDSLPKPVGVLACNDKRGRQVIEACAVGGMHVPNDVAVVGIDEDRLLSEFSNPPLSSVALDAEQGGYRAAELLDGMMSGQTKRQRQLILVDALWVVARPSTDVIAVEDRDVANAVMYIRDNARRPIGVQDVVKHSAVSRRALEIRFHRSLGRSIREEIERVRLNWVKQLLVETDLPIGKVAYEAGFSSLSYMGKVFHSTVGNTLAAYRRDHRAHY
jgi:LacI family transcriptional regulator